MFDVLPLAVLLVLIVSHLVWRGRYRKINQRLEATEQSLRGLENELRQVVGSPTTTSTSPVAPEAEPAEAPVAALVEVGESGAVTTTRPSTAKTAAEMGRATEVTSEIPAMPSHAAEASPPVSGWTRLDAADKAIEKADAKPASRRIGLLAKSSASLRSTIQTLRSDPDLETLIGASWLNKIGVATLVIGLALLTSYTLRYVGPQGKIAIGVGVALLLLGGGVWLETRRQYTLFARPLIGGGWALLYFTAYASYNFEASRIISDPIAGLCVMLAVAVGMIGHSLRYRSELITGAAYVLAFVAIDINPLDIYSLLASALLGASLVFLLRFFAWYRLALGAVLSTYLTNYLWMIASAPSEPPSAEAFWIAQGMLILYWSIFATADFLRERKDPWQGKILLAITVANTVAFTAFSFHIVDSAYPELSHRLAAFIAAGALVMASATSIRGRQPSYRFYGLFAGLMAAIAVPLTVINLSLSGEWLASGWLLVAELSLAAGIWRREFGFRIESYLIAAGAIAAAFAISVFDLGTPVLAAAGGATRWSNVVVIAVALYANEFLLARFHQQLDPRESPVGEVAGHLATALLAALVFQEIDANYVGIIWLTGAVATFEFGLFRGHAPSRIRGYALALGGFAGLILFNSNLVVEFFRPSTASFDWLVLAAAALVYYGIAWQLKTAGKRVVENEARLYPIAAHAGAVLLALFVWNELPMAAVAVAWGLLALFLRETGNRLPEAVLRLQGYALALAAWGRLFVIDFVSIGEVAGISTRVLTVIPLAALLYYFRHGFVSELDNGRIDRFEVRLQVLFCFLATVALFALARFEFGRNDAVVAWSLLAVALLVIGVHFSLWEYRIQAYLIALASFARSWTTNFYLTGEFYGVPERVATTIPAIIALFFLGLVWRQRRAAEFERSAVPAWRAIGWIDRHATQIFSGLGVALTALLIYYSVGTELLTMAWAVEGLVVTAAGFLLRERTLRLSGIGLLALCLVKGLVIDLADVEPVYRYLSFVVLGVILMGISFAYTRYRNVLKTYI